MKKCILVFNTLFPYLILLYLIAFIQSGLWPLGMLCALWVVFIVLNGLFLLKRIQTPEADSLVLASFIIKLAQIPAFLMIFFIGILTIAYPALPLLLIILDWFAVLLTGFVSTGNICLLYRKHTMSKSMAIILGVMSFIFCADVAAAVVVWWKDKHR